MCNGCENDAVSYINSIFLTILNIIFFENGMETFDFFFITWKFSNITFILHLP